MENTDPRPVQAGIHHNYGQQFPHGAGWPIGYEHNINVGQSTSMENPYAFPNHTQMPFGYTHNYALLSHNGHRPFQFGGDPLNAIPPQQDYQSPFQSTGWQRQNLYEGYRHYNHGQNHSLTQGEQGASQNGICCRNRPPQDYQYPPQNTGWQNLYEGYPHYDHGPNHLLTHGEQGAPQNGICYQNKSPRDHQYLHQNTTGWQNLYEGYRHYNHGQNHSLTQGEQGASQNGICCRNRPPQDYQYPPQNTGWQNLYESYRHYDHGPTHSLTQGEQGASQNGICYGQPPQDYHYPPQNTASCATQSSHPQYDYMENRGERSPSHEGICCRKRTELCPDDQNLSTQSTLNENQLSSDKSVAITPVSTLTVTTNESQVLVDKSVDLPAEALSLTIKPNNELGCDTREMYMETSDKSAKKLCCPFCEKLVIKLSRHMETMHSEEPDVKKLVQFPKASKERRTIQDSLRKIGQTNFNKKAALNKKQLIPSRRPNPKHSRKVTDQKTCPYCFGSYAKSGLNFHIKNKCPKKPIQDGRTDGERVISALTSSVERRYHEHANSALQNVFDNCHNDDVVRGIRFDWLAVVYGNRLTLKYNKPRNRKMIKNRMRLIGRVLMALKKIEPEVTELAKFLVPKYYDIVVDAIRSVARVDEVRNEFVAPATASSCVTAIRQICQMVAVEYIKKDDQENQRLTRDFLTIMNADMHISINKMVNETQSRMARQRKVILPSSDDVKRLVDYIETERSASFSVLSKCFDFKEWRRLTELSMASIIVFNRRRVGDTQNILDEDFACKEMITDETHEELLSMLPEQSKRIAKQYSRMKVRGKKNRTVPVLLKANIADCLQLLISHRKEAGVSPLNNFLFGLPSKKDIYQVVDAGRVLRKFAIASGAKNPTLLTATNLRKHLATICVTLQLNDTCVADVAEFMGHAEKVHREHYRQNPIERQIVQMSQVLEAAQGDLNFTNEDKTSREQSLETAQGDLIGMNQNPISGERIAVNTGRKRKLPSTELKGNKKPRRSRKKGKHDK